MRKVLIIGSGGAGKSILATQLGARLGLPVLHLDALYWQPGWQETPKEAWQPRIADLVQRDCWIMDGNYGGTLAERGRACDTVIVLAVPRWQCLYRVVKRAIRYRGHVRPDLNPGCPEQWSDWPFLQWIWTYPKTRLPKILELLRAYESQTPIVILQSSAEVRRFRASLTPPTSTSQGAALRRT